MELTIFQLIITAGTAKTHYMEAIQKAKAGLYAEAEQLNQEADEVMRQRHASHTDLVQREAAGEPVQMSLLLSHAEDQMMSVEVFKVMAEEIIALYKKVNG